MRPDLPIRFLTSCAALCLLASIAPAQPDDPFAPPAKKPAKEPPTAKRIKFDVSVEPKQARRGETVKLSIRGAPGPGFHTYPILQRTDAQDEIGLSSIIFEETPGLKPLEPLT